MRSKKRRIMLWRIAASAVLLGAGIATQILDVTAVPIIAFILAYIAVGYDVLIRAARKVLKGKVLDENFLMSIASIGAFVIGEYAEAVAVMLLYQVGELFQSYAVDKSRSSIAEIMKIRPDVARVIRDGEELEVDPEEVGEGEVITVRVGDRVPLDGVVIGGTTYVDTSALTGESVPVELKEGDAAISGSINLSGVISVRTSGGYESSTVARILELTENAIEKKSKAENFISKFALVYTPIVVVLAMIVAIVPSLITSEWQRWVYVALEFLVVSCPCAIVISVPLAFFGCIGGASNLGVLIKGGNYVEVLSKVDCVALDKTGTVTEGRFSVSKVCPEDGRDRVLSVAAFAEARSTHPIARAVCAAEKPGLLPESVSETAGGGVIARLGERVATVGSREFLQQNGIDGVPECGDTDGSTVLVAENGEYIGYIVVRDSVKQGSKSAIAEMKRDGAHVVMLSGDRDSSVKSVANEVGIEEYYARMLPQDKTAKIEQLIGSGRYGCVAFVGDGINDAPSLVRADIGIAMGGIGSDSAVEAADAVLMRDDLGSLVKVKSLCKKTIRIVKQNIIFSLAVKIGIMLLAALGLSNMWLAVIGDVGVAIIAICNSFRARKLKNG